MAEVCAICEADTFGDSHWHNEREAWVCPDHCDDPDCLTFSTAASFVPDDTSQFRPGDLRARHAEVLAAVAPLEVAR